MGDTSDLIFQVDLDPAILWTYVIVAGLLLLKVLMGVGVALRDGTFDVRRLPQFLETNVLPYLLPLAGMAALSLIVPAIKVVYLGSASLYGMKLLTDIKDKVSQLYLLVTAQGIRSVE
jgi:hypothetical protein